MTRKMLIPALLFVAVAVGGAFAIPTIKITTADGVDPRPGTMISGSSVGNSPAFNFDYSCMSKFEITGADNQYHNFSREKPIDSVRMRGNSTANADMPKKPYRIKFGEKVSLFGKTGAKSWVLLANHMDKTFAMNALAFRIGEIIGLEYTPTFEYVNLEINGKHKGIYMLTEQIQTGEGRVDVGEKKGWLVEFNFHNPDANDISFTTASNRYGLPVFIKSPEIAEFGLTYKGSNVSSYPELAFVKSDFEKIMDTLANETRFNAGAHRDYIDLTSYAKYVFVQQFMANFEWAQLGYVGSNFAYKDKDEGSRMKAGPLWDFDLATGVTGAGSIYTFFSSSSSSMSILPPSSGTRNAFYKRLLADEVFRARYRKVWEDNKSKIQALAANGGFIDTIVTLLKSHVAANYEVYSDWNATNLSFMSTCFVGCGVVGSGPADTTAYKAEITKLKTWWGNRYTKWDTDISGTVSFGSARYMFDASKDVPDRPTTSVNNNRPAVKTAARPAAVKNGVKLNIVNKGVVKIYTLDGREVRSVKLTRGDHNLRMGDLPKGMYMVRVSMDGNVKTLRVPVR